MSGIQPHIKHIWGANPRNVGRPIIVPDYSTTGLVRGYTAGPGVMVNRLGDKTDPSELFGCPIFRLYGSTTGYISFDNLTYGANLNTTINFISLWFRPFTSGSDIRLLNQGAVMMALNSLQVQYYQGAFTNIDGVARLNTWSHLVAMNRPFTRVKVFHNSVEASSETAATLTGNPFSIGRRYLDASGNPFNGEIAAICYGYRQDGVDLTVEDAIDLRSAHVPFVPQRFDYQKKFVSTSAPAIRANFLTLLGVS